MSAPYIINVANPFDGDLSPTEAAFTEEEAKAIAQEISRKNKTITEVVYMPEDDEEINDVICQFSNGKEI